MQKNDSIMNIIMLTMRELKSLIASAGCVTIFVVAEEYVKGVQGIEEKSNDTLFNGKIMLESGRLVDAISNLPVNEAKTDIKQLEDVKYGFKNS